jgi:hypothetical protein
MKKVIFFVLVGRLPGSAEIGRKDVCRPPIPPFGEGGAQGQETFP